MTKLIIFLVSSARYAPPRIGGFIYNNDYGKFLYQGRPLSVEEFNDAAARVLDQHNPHLPYTVSVRTVEVADESPQEVSEETESDAAEAEAPAEDEAGPVEEAAPEPEEATEAVESSKEATAPESVPSQPKRGGRRNSNTPT